MSTQIWWKGRLEEGCPIWDHNRRIEGSVLRNTPDRKGCLWPTAVARAALREDYLEWFEQQFLMAYHTPYFEEFPENRPKPDDELTFFTSMGPFLYLVGKERQVRSYKVTQNLRFENGWVSGRVAKYFVKLLDWEAHRAAFEEYTGMVLDVTSFYGNEENARRIAKAAMQYMERLEENKGDMGPAMFSSHKTA